MRTILLATLFAASASSAHAAPTTWNFSYTGFDATTRTIDLMSDLDETTHVARPDLSIGGHFTGFDDNHDGTIGLSELKGFDFNGFDYMGCMASPSPYSHCNIERFSFTADGKGGGTLDFSAAWSGNDEFYSGWSGSATAGKRISDIAYNRYSETDKYYDWTSATQFSIAPAAPVPEPSSGVMAIAGVLAIAATARARRSRPGPAA